MTRPTVDETLMQVARVFAQRGTCSRMQVGCVIAKEGRILTSGYNGAPAGFDHCDHTRIPNAPCSWTVHAEANALVFAAKHGVRVWEATLYTTLSPCFTCAGMILNAGIARVVYSTPYRCMDGVAWLESGGVPVEVCGL